MVRTTLTSPVPRAGSMLPERTTSGRAWKASGTASASPIPIAKPAAVMAVKRSSDRSTRSTGITGSISRTLRRLRRGVARAVIAATPW